MPYAGRGVVLYCMPTQRMMDDYTQARESALGRKVAGQRRRTQSDPRSSASNGRPRAMVGS